jgi:phosphoribosylaminoimidazole (AIR) synthetase
VYRWLQQKGQVSDAEMYRVFNMGIGMIAIIDPAQLETLRVKLSEPVHVIGYLSEKQIHRVVLK